MQKPRISPKKAAEHAILRLKEKADSENAEQVQKYFKEQVRAFGVRAGELRNLAKELYGMIKDTWDVNDATDFCEMMLSHSFIDPKGIGILVLARFRRSFPRDLFFKAKKWLSADLCDNWATVDALSSEILSPLLDRYPELIEEIKMWTHFPNRWVKRASAVAFVTFARKGIHLDTVYDIAVSLFPEDDDLIQKANGWLLREAGKTDMPRLEGFLLRHGRNIPRTTLRYSIERFEEKKRKEILKATKLLDKAIGVILEELKTQEKELPPIPPYPKKDK